MTKQRIFVLSSGFSCAGDIMVWLAFSCWSHVPIPSENLPPQEVKKWVISTKCCWSSNRMSWNWIQIDTLYRRPNKKFNIVDIPTVIKFNRVIFDFKWDIAEAWYFLHLISLVHHPTLCFYTLNSTMQWWNHHIRNYFGIQINLCQFGSKCFIVFEEYRDF